MAEAPVAKKAGYLQLTFLIYGAVCGGAFGLESMIGSSGPGISLCILIVMPFVFSVPLSLAVSELTAAFPVEGGNYRWSRMAFGDFWGFQAGWWAWGSALATSASFAALFANYLKSTWYPDMSSLNHWLICLALIWVVHGLNVLGIEAVGNSAVLMSFLLLVPFVIMTFLGITHWSHNPFVPFVAPNVGLAGLGTALATATWLYSGYEKLSCAAEEVENPRQTFPPALFSAAFLAMLSYVLPTLCVLAFLGNWQAWDQNFTFTNVGQLMGGTWLQELTVAAGLISNALLLNVTMMAASRSLMTMSEDRLMPSMLAHLSPRTKTPTWSLLIGSLILSYLTWQFDFNKLLIIYAWFTMGTSILVYLNVWKLRRTQPQAPRSFTAPGGSAGLLAMALPTLALACLGTATYLFPDWMFSREALYIALGALLSGPLLYPLVKGWSAQKELDGSDAHDPPDPGQGTGFLCRNVVASN